MPVVEESRKDDQVNVEYDDGRPPTRLDGLNEEDLLGRTQEAMLDPGIKRITIVRLRPPKGTARLPKKGAALSSLGKGQT